MKRIMYVLKHKDNSLYYSASGFEVNTKNITEARLFYGKANARYLIKNNPCFMSDYKIVPVTIEIVEI